MATYEVQIDFGSGPVDITSYLVGQHPVKRSRSIHNNLKPVIGTCDFTINRNTTIVNQFLTSSTDPVVVITKNSAPYFKGTVRRTVKVTVGQLRVDALKCQCVDPLYRMDGRKYSLSSVWKDYKICNPSAKNQSILHQLFYLAGYTDAELDLHLVDITIGNYALDGTRSSLLIRDLIETVLRDCVHTLKVLPTGVITLYDLAPASYVSTATLATGAGGSIVGGYTVERDESKAEAVDVTYWDHMVLPGAVLFEDTTGAAPGVECSIPVPAGTYFPDGASADTAIRCVFDVKDYDLVSAASPVVEWSHTGNVAKLVEVPDGLGMFVNFYSSTGGVIIRFRIVGDATVKKNQNKISVEIVSSSDEREEIKTELLTESVSAGKLAAGRAAWHKNSLYRYTITVIATTAVEPGQIVSLSDPGILGSSQVLRVLSVDDGDDEKQYRAICEGVSDYGATVVSGIPIPARNSVPVRDGFSIDEILANVPMMEFRYTRSLAQPETPTDAAPAGWELYIPSGTGYGWQTRALKYADGTLVSAWEEAIRVPTTDDIENIRNGDLVDFAIARAKLEAAFVAEHDTVISDLSQETFDRIAAVTGVQVQLDVVKPKVSTLEDIGAIVEDLVRDTEARTIDNEYGFLRAYQEIDGEKTRVSRLEVDIDGISAVVAEVEPTITRVTALEIDIDGITQTVAEITPEVEKIAQIEIDVGSITSRVAAVEPEAAKVSSIEQNVDTIRASVYTDGYTGSKIAQLQIDVNQISLTVADMIGTYWEAETLYSLGDRINVRGDSYECTDAGTSGTTEPTWDQDNPVTDGTVGWTYQGTYVADLTQLQLNTDHIASIVADGGYWTDDDPPEFVPTLGYTVAKQTKDRFDLFVAGTPEEGDEAAWIVQQDQISSFVTGTDITAVTDPLAERVTTAEGEIDTITGTTIPGLSGSIQDVADALSLTDEEIAALTDPETGRLHLIETDISTINQTAGEVSIRVDTLYSPDSPPSVRDRDEYLAWLADAYNAAAAQFVVNELGIRIEVQDRQTMGVELNAAIVIEADRITSEVSRASEAEGTLASQIVQTAESINLAVFGADNDGPLPAAQGQIAILADSVAARVQGGGSSAFLGLQITLPLEITASTMTAMSTAEGSSSAMVLAVYAPGTDGYYRLKPGATIQDFEDLRTALRAAGLLGSRFTVEADELVFSGDSLFTNGKLSVGNVDGLGALAVLDSLSAGDVGAATIAQAEQAAQAAADALLPQIDSKIEAWYQVADPADAWTTDALKIQHDGDQWYNTTSQVWKRYRRTGENTGTWDLLQEADALTALTNAGTAQDTADKKNTIFATLALAQATGVIGDCFLDSSLLYRATVSGASITVANSTRLTPRRHNDYNTLPSTSIAIIGDTFYKTDTKQWYVYLRYWNGSSYVTGWMIDGPAITASGVGADAAGAAAAAQAAAELAAKNAMAYKLGFADWAEMEAAARASGTLIDGGYINTQLIEAGAIKAGMIDVEDLRATEGFFEDIDVTGTASVKELLFKDFEPGDIILKKALDLLIPEQALQTKYSKRQICGTGNVKITLEANHVHSGYSTTLDIVRNRAGVKSSIYVEVFSSYSGWVEREITPISVIEGDIIEFKGYGTGGGLLGVSTLSLRNICIKIDTYPGFMSWIGTDSESSTDPGFPR